MHGMDSIWSMAWKRYIMNIPETNVISNVIIINITMQFSVFHQKILNSE